MVGTRSHRVFGPIQGLLDRGAFGHLADAQLLEIFARTSNGDSSAAFETLVLRHGPSVLRTCRMVLGDRAEADDAFQATFLVLARRASSLRPCESIGPWLEEVARRISLKTRSAAIRRRMHERESAVSLLVDSDPRSEVSESLRDEIDRLPEHLRAPIVLCYLEQMSYQAAAKELGVTQGTVRGRLAKARELLKRRLSRGPDRHIPASGREMPGSLDQKLPFMLVDATRRAVIAFSSHAADYSRIAASVLKLAEGTLKMMLVTRIARILVIGLIGVAGTALVGYQTSGVRVAAATTPGIEQSAAGGDSKTAPLPPTKPTRSDQHHENSRDILIQGAAIQTRAENDQVAVDGPGTLSLWVERGFLTERIEDLEKALVVAQPVGLRRTQASAVTVDPANPPGEHMSRGETALLKISWTGRMQLVGRANDAAGTPAARFEIQGQVTAQTDDALIRCENGMVVSTTGPLPLERVLFAAKGPANVPIARHPQTTLATIRASRNVVVTSNVVDPDKPNVPQQHRFQADDTLTYDRRTGTYQIDGKGQVSFFQRIPAATAPVKNDAPGPDRIVITFRTGMNARLGAGVEPDPAVGRADFSGKVTIARFGPTAKTTSNMNGVMPKGTIFLTDNLRCIVKTRPPSAHSSRAKSLCIKASGNVSLEATDVSIGAEEAYLDLPLELTTPNPP